MTITLYNKRSCLECTMVKQFFANRRIPIEIINFDEEVRTELMLHGIILEESPILQIGSIFLVRNDLIFEGEVNKYLILQNMAIQGELQERYQLSKAQNKFWKDVSL